MKQLFSLEDWQETETTDWKTGIPVSIDLEVEMLRDKLVVTAPDGRSFALELQDGVLRILAYEGEGGKDAPIVLKSPLGGPLEVDRHDYDAEPKPSTLEP